MSTTMCLIWGSRSVPTRREGSGRSPGRCRCDWRSRPRTCWRSIRSHVLALTISADPPFLARTPGHHWRSCLAHGLYGLLALIGGLSAGQARQRAAAEGVPIRLDEPGDSGQPERGEEHAGEDVGGVMLAPVHAGG